MVKYYYIDDTFVIEDYLKAKTFSSFLPAVAGVDGKPLWAFYANVGQAMGGFGVNNKNTPITPFDSAFLAYQNIPIKSFRTFIKIDNTFSEAFQRYSNSKKTMFINKSNISIKEETKEYVLTITYSSVPKKNYTGLIRKVSLISKLSGNHTFEVIDGTPTFFPNGLSNFCYKELVSLMSAYCQINYLENNTPFVKFKTSTSDNSIVSLSETGNGYFYLDENNNYLKAIVDNRVIFNEDKTLLNPENFIDKTYEELINEENQIENKLPCAFITFKKEFKENEEYKFYGLFSMFDNETIFKNCLKEINASSLDKMIIESEEIIKELLKPSKCHTGIEIFDKYVEQSFLDNNLRGGFPIKLNNQNDGEVYYVFSRKHGDMERDYNSFEIPSKYYSSGCGNFRDVNQNRRNDLYFYPFVKDYNIKIFFNLIQVDGQNPLNVKPLKFKYTSNKNNILEKIDDSLKTKIEILLDGFEPSEIYTILKDNCNLIKEDYNDLFSLILKDSIQQIEANFAEGYWVDHWTYNVDLLENYESIYVDKMESLLFNNTYKYFYSLVYVEPRSEKYCFIENNKIRQYGAIDLKRFKDKCQELSYDPNKTYWLKDKNGNEIQTTLISKIFNLILIKFSTLDSKQLGIEMECEKPGWNDAMNGLPGLFASSLSESVELLRLINFSIRNFSKFIDKKFTILNEQYQFYIEVKNYLFQFLHSKLSSFNYWDLVTTSREKFRKELMYNCVGEIKEVHINDVLNFLNDCKIMLTKGIKEAKNLTNGILPSYLIYEVDKYELNSHINHLGYQTVKVKSFKLKTIPHFLEASARSFKLGKEMITKNDYKLIKESDIYDKKLHFYKTCASIEDAPFEIGRVHAFTKGWLERECNFLHMTYKYLLGLLKASLYEEFYQEIKDNMVCFMNPYVYGRSIIENSSFIVPSVNPDKKLHGQGFFARLTGANAELLNMYTLMFIGEHLFTLKDNILTLDISPKLSKEFFDKENKVSFTLFNHTKVTYINNERINLYDNNLKFDYILDGRKLNEIAGNDAYLLRDLKVNELIINVHKI